MKPFGYTRDPVCLAACACYAVNRWLVPAALKGVFLRSYFSDLLLIPAALPIMLWIQRKLRLRLLDTPPTRREILMHLVVWSAAAELIGPHFFARATGDPWDVVAYATGAFIAALCWQSV